MAEFELSLLRQRSLEARRQKARRGEMQFSLPAGFRWTFTGQIEKDPDRRAQQAIELVFRKMTELGSVRQVLIWFRQQNLCHGIGPISPFPRGDQVAECVCTLVQDICTPLYFRVAPIRATNLMGRQSFSLIALTRQCCHRRTVCMGNTIDLTTLLMNASRECRLVLNEEQTKILGRGETIKEGAEEAKINGVDDPIVI